MTTKILFPIVICIYLVFIFSSCHEGSTNPKETIEFGTVTDIDGNVYRTVKICGKWWMAENLKVSHYRNGDPIRHCISKDDWIDTSRMEIGAWCYYDNNPENNDIYGKLYNWYPINDPRGIAPEGWHVPSDEEWVELELCLGISAEKIYMHHCRGANEGYKLKDTGTIEDGTGYWKSPNTLSTNETGFTALPSGGRWFHGAFSYLGEVANFWTATEDKEIEGTAFIRYITNLDSGVCRISIYIPTGLSIRCIKDD